MTYFLASVSLWASPLPLVAVLPPAAIVVSRSIVLPGVARLSMVLRSRAVSGIRLKEPGLLVGSWTATPRTLILVVLVPRRAPAERLPWVRHLFLLTDAVVVSGIPGLALSKELGTRGTLLPAFKDWISTSGTLTYLLDPQNCKRLNDFCLK